jgi:hypothetical protein
MDEIIDKDQSVESHLKIYKDRSVLVEDDGSETIFKEGLPSTLSKERTKKIKLKLEDGFLNNIIRDCKSGKVTWILSSQQEHLLKKLVDGVTSEHGRAVLAVTILQLCIKCIDRSSDIRLHKAGRSGESFSWTEGISMRTFDSKYIVPILRKENLLKYNIFGAFLTRSLAENYPYTKFYKASIRGPKSTWFELVDELEAGRLDPEGGLKKVISLLIIKSEEFIKLSKDTISLKNLLISKSENYQAIVPLIIKHIANSSYPSRLLEIAMHSMLQVLDEEKSLGGSLRPLSQMRSANKKAGNIGDIEILASTDINSEIVEAWDAKYGKPYLYDELDELIEKLALHKTVRKVGFVSNVFPDIRKEIVEKINTIEDLYGIRPEIISFDKWIKNQFERSKFQPEKISRDWMTAYIETICQRRRMYAPIDEPSETWVKEMHTLLLEFTNK